MIRGSVIKNQFGMATKLSFPIERKLNLLRKL